MPRVSYPDPAPAPLVPPPPPGATVLAVDVGGTKLAAAVVDASGALHAPHRAPTVGEGAEGVFAALCGVVDEVLADWHGGHAGASGGGAPPVVCGVGCGGPMTRGGAAVSPVNIVQWRDFPLRDRLADHLGLPVAVDNDAKALALAEGWRGRARGVRDFVGMVVSTGVGGGIVLDGRLLDGADGNAGHIGHVVVEPDGARCGCGSRGCLEAEASGTAIAARTGRPAAEAGPEVRERTGRLVGRAVASVAALLDLRLAVVAGSVALGFGEDFFRAAQQELDERARIDHARGARILPAGLGHEAPLVGAAAVGWRALASDGRPAPGRPSGGGR